MYFQLIVTVYTKLVYLKVPIKIILTIPVCFVGNIMYDFKKNVKDKYQKKIFSVF